MIALDQTVAVLLCAGHSRRFEGGDKLLAPLSGKPMVAHAASMLATLPFGARLATVRADQIALHDLLRSHGFDLVEVAEDTTQPQSALAGIEAAMIGNPTGICLMLGDMPFVPADHIQALAKAATGARPAASLGDGWTGPPWIASAGWLCRETPGLKAAIGEQALAISLSIDQLRDIDCLADLRADDWQGTVTKA
jgi:molybdenum cofactor cytidylyltransferase